MASIYPVLRKKTNKYGLYPIAIRITLNRRTTYLYTGQYIEAKFWDNKKGKVKNSHLNASRLNHLILSKMVEANQKLLESEASGRKLSVGKLKDSIKRETNNDFKSVADIYLNNIKDRKKSNQYKTEKNRVEQFLNFAGNDIKFHEIDVALLNNFSSFLQFKKNRAKRTVVNFMICIRAIYNLALTANRADRND